MHILFKNTNIDETKLKITKYKKGNIIFNDGDICDNLGLVISGSIRIVTNTFTENEFEINRINENGIFGNNILFTNSPIYLGTGTAIKETSIIYIRKQELIKLFKNEEFLINYLKLTSTQTRQIQRKIKVLSQTSIRDKIMFLLYDNYFHNKNKDYFIKSKINFANFINCTRPSLSRELINLKKEGIIDYDRYKITLLK